MDRPLPTFDEVVDLICSPRPPLACRVVKLRDGVERSARVIFDGNAGWFIESDERVEFRHSDDFVVFEEGGELKRVGPGVQVHSNAWVKTPIEGRLMRLDEATGRVIGRDEVEGRRAILVEFLGLRLGEDTVFQLHIDLETGIVLRMSRADLGLILQLEDLRIGAIEGPR